MAQKIPLIPPRKITKKAINALRPMERPYTLWDIEIKGFGVKMLPSAQMSYVVQFRMGKGRSAKLFKRRIDEVAGIPGRPGLELVARARRCVGIRRQARTLRRDVDPGRVESRAGGQRERQKKGSEHGRGIR